MINHGNTFIPSVMSSINDCTHRIKIVNFDSKDVVTYPIVRLVGLVESQKSPSCQMEDTVVTIVSETLNVEKSVEAKNDKFKILLELCQGTNEFLIKFACRSLAVSLEYYSSDFEYTVMPMYVICEGHDGFFQAPPNEKNDIKSACERILLCSKLLQCFTAEKLLENGLGRKTFHLENKCQIFRSNINYLDARKMTQEQLWENIGRDIMKSDLGSEQRKYLAFLSCTNYNGDKFSESNTKSHEDVKLTDAYVALGGGGLALFGTACLYTWPEHFDDIIPRFEDKTAVDKTKYLDDSCYRGTQGSCFSTTLGSVLHELYHTFDLGHTETGVMGRGFDNISKFFTYGEEDAKRDEFCKRFLDQIEFKEELESDTLSKRLVNEHKRKGFQVTKKFEENDWTFLTKSCAVLLAYHRWFNGYTNGTSFTLTYDASSKFIRSTAGIRVVEIRKQPDEMILRDWTFEGKVLKFSFRIPEETFAENAALTLFVEDNLGNILKNTQSPLK